MDTRDELSKPAGRGGRERKRELRGPCPVCYCEWWEGCNVKKRQPRPDRYKGRRRGKR